MTHQAVELSLPPLTETQGRVLRFVVDFAQLNGFPPTQAEVGVALGYKSSNSVALHIETLVRKGYVERKANTARGIRLTDSAKALEMIGEKR